jgi:hypothetical protein
MSRTTVITPRRNTCRCQNTRLTSTEGADSRNASRHGLQGRNSEADNGGYPEGDEMEGATCSSELMCLALADVQSLSVTGRSDCVPKGKYCIESISMAHFTLDA